VTRLISGALRSMQLAVPPSGTRPTTDRVREACFSAVEARLDLSGCAVLDLYAGSGALGLEALSRGAGSVDLVDSSPQALRVMEKNAAEARRRLGLVAGDVRVRRGELPGAIDGPCPRPGGYDLVLVDPPYDLVPTQVPALLERLVAHGWLSEIGHVLCESSARTADAGWPADIESDFDRTYGETRVRIGVVAGD